MQSTYQEIEDIHCGSISLVATPACNILLNLIVNGKGNLTGRPISALIPFSFRGQLTDNKSREKGINPPHDQRLRNDHRHIPLHHAHHSLHSRRVRHWIRCRLTLLLWLFQERPVFVGIYQVSFASFKGRRRKIVRVHAQVYAAEKGALFANGWQLLFLGRGGHQNGGIVAQDTC